MKEIKLLLCFTIAFFMINSAVQLNAAVYTFQAGNKTYQIVDQKLNYASAAQYAVQRGGYLAEIESSTEQTAVYNALVSKVNSTYTVVQDGGGIAYVWIGANDLNTEGTWIWDGNNDGTGINFWIGEGTNTSGTGYSVEGRYQNWGGNLSAGAPKEPDNYGTGQDAAAIALATWPDAPPQYKIGDAGEWNDIAASNTLYFVVEYDVSGIPSTPSKPTGVIELCQDAENTTYTTTATNNALTYSWMILPTNAGSVSGAGIEGTVNWNSTFYGTAKLIVKAVNPLGESNYSDTLEIEVLQGVAKAAKPTGNQVVCNNEATSNYSTDEISTATAYYWEMIPNYAGTLNANLNNATITWANNYTGEVSITVYAENNCGQGEKSDKLVIERKSTIKLVTPPLGPEEVNFNALDTKYSINPVANVSKYLWKIEPINAGEFVYNDATPNNVEVEVNWSETFDGTAQISVSAENDCGAGEYSPILTVRVKDIPGMPSKPTCDDTEICQGTDEITVLNVEKVDNNENYSWVLNPESAGYINGNKTEAVIAWSADFSGTAEVTVATVGINGNSEMSEALLFTVNSLPEVPSKPSSVEKMCAADEMISISAEIATSANYYEWKVTPEEAGTIENNTNTADFVLNSGFTGDFNVQVAAVNDCGKSDFSEAITINVNDIPATPDKPTGEVEIELNGNETVETTYSTNEVENAKNYNWILTPDNAGTLEINSNTVVVKWINTGAVTLTVNAENDCGNSEDSEILEINVNGGPISVREDFKFINAKVYPNPSNNEINIELGADFYGGTIEISDLLGNKLIQSEVKNNLQTISVSELPAGKYFITLTHNGHIYSDTFVKQ